jgi:hypothetical protein
LAVAAALPAIGAAPAQSVDPGAAQEVLPDLRQLVPANVSVGLVGGEWRLGFDSEVANDGPGYLHIKGTGPGNAPMTADQIVQMDDGTSTTLPGAGTMHYVIGGGHEHWHLLDFERYELRTGDSSQTLVSDQKTGFCLADSFTADQCGRNHPERTSVDEGIHPGGSDRYLGYLEGQYLTLDPVSVPAGSYVLVHRVNPTGALRVVNPGNDAASVRITINWSSGGKPAMEIVNTCPGTTDCPAPPEPPIPDPKPQPGPGAPAPQPVAPAPGPVEPAPEPQPIPIVNPVVTPPRAAQAAMSRGMAVRLARRAIVKSSRWAPGKLRMICGRDDRATFTCRTSWHAPGSDVWSGRVRVWYRLHDSQLSWFYDLSATRRADGRRLRIRAARGSAARLVFAAADGSLICRRPGTATTGP